MAGVTAGGGTAGVRAHARIEARPDGRGSTVLPVLAGEGPLALRRTRGTAGEARVTVVGAMSGPLGGDRFLLEADVAADARLGVGSAAATLALPGQGKDPARQETRLRVAAGAALRWEPEPLISVRGSDLELLTRAEVAEGGRLLLREELVLGRHAEPPGTLTSRLTLRVGGRLVLDQELACGPGAPGGWDGPAVLAGHRAVGQILLVDPAFAVRPPPSRLLGQAASLVALPGPAALITALAPDALRLRRLLEEALRATAGPAGDAEGG
ncbi:urease accessory protein UreD [Streptomyces abyssomicinicus]|uniref:urease accessory protein UreD n=1 Tax=Streptomyces abyssomicinicus TaxID=574929 RepID=UPI001FE83F19|nr:urease accessory protein UreD [Streptomyces abyssomicinicus]